jgi:hypothetical protein
MWSVEDKSTDGRRLDEMGKLEGICS